MASIPLTWDGADRVTMPVSEAGSQAPRSWASSETCVSTMPRRLQQALVWEVMPSGLLRIPAMIGPPLWPSGGDRGGDVGGASDELEEPVLAGKPMATAIALD